VACENRSIHSLRNHYDFAFVQMQEEHNIDPVAQQELLERYRREAEDYDHVKEVKRRKQAQDMKVNGNI